MDIVTLQRDLRSAGFSIEIADIQALIEDLKRAIADGRVKQSTAPSHRYPLKQMFQFLQGKEVETNYPYLWNKAIKRYPKLADFKTLASYSQTAKYQKNTQGITSLTLAGVISLAAVLYYNHSNGNRVRQVDFSDTTDPRIPIRNAYIYVLKDTVNKVLKVGLTGDLETRLQQHKSSNPFLVPIVFFPIENRSIESKLHQALEVYRVSGLREWYNDCVEVRQLISNYFCTL